MTRQLGMFLAFCALLVGGQRIAQEKCSQYREITIHRSSMIPLIVNPKPVMVERFICSNSVDLIVGGNPTKLGEFPHHAVLGLKKSNDTDELEFRCGGSLISERFVLTAAHCFAQGKPSVVRLGTNKIDDYVHSVDLDVEKAIRYDKHNSKRSYHDIGLVKLMDDVIFTNFIRPACLWTDSKINVSSVTATGFGNTENGTTSDTMLKVSLDFLDKINCNAQFGHLTTKFNRGIIDEQLCIGTLTEGKDTCQGDSGGPVQTLLEGMGCTYHVVGVTSIGPLVCGIGKSAAIYTKVSAYIPWIEEIVWQN